MKYLGKTKDMDEVNKIFFLLNIKYFSNNHNLDVE